MNPRPLGRSGLVIPPLVLGGNVFGWTVDANRAFVLLDAFIEAGLRMVDTADSYSHWVPGNQGGESETIIGRWLAQGGERRERALIATKVGKQPGLQGLAPATIRKAVEGSLRRLGVERIDLLYAHMDDGEVPLEDSLGAFAQLIEEGKLRAIGASNYGALRLAEALAASARFDLPRYEVIQPEYNLMERHAYEDGLEALARTENLGVLGYYALASGFLSGKYRREEDLASGAARTHAVRKYLNGRGLRVLAALDEVAAAHAASPAQIALAWLLARPGFSAPIASATSLAQLGEMVAATRLELAADEISRLDAASAD